MKNNAPTFKVISLKGCMSSSSSGDGGGMAC